MVWHSKHDSTLTRTGSILSQRLRDDRQSLSRHKKACERNGSIRVRLLVPEDTDIQV